MKKIIKKIAAAAMAFTLLATGSAVTAKSQIKASAIKSSTYWESGYGLHCEHKCGRYMVHDDWKTCWYNKHKQTRRVKLYCYNCGADLAVWFEERYI